jgi:hypothetical protein
VIGVLLIALPIGADIACVPYGEEMNFWSIAEGVDNLKSSRFLALQAVRVNRVDHGHTGFGGKLAN